MLFGMIATSVSFSLLCLHVSLSVFFPFFSGVVL